MALAVLNQVRIAGVASAVPRQIVSNSDYTTLSEEQREKIIKYTGIRFRRWAPEELCCSDLCQASAEKLLAELGWKPEQVEVVIFIAQTSDYPFPATAQLLQKRLNLPQSCLAFDINLGCSGYTYGLFVLGSLLQASGLKRGLVLCGDVSKMHGDSDPTSAVLFGHAGTATAMEYQENSKPMSFELGSDGGGFKVIYVPAGGCRAPVAGDSFQKAALEGGGSRGDTDVVLDAAEIMNFTLREVPASIKRLLEFSGQAVPQVDAFVFHQANLFINTQVARKLGIKPHQLPSTLYDFGNTSSASVPLTITTQLRERLAKESLQVVMSGFGVGLSWASLSWQAENVVCPQLIEL
jgi:3-oxoacyl-[acyl-carrier-protein] synthase III